MAWNKDFESAFYPHAVAIVGLSKSATRDNRVWSSVWFILSYEELGFRGRIYPVNPKASEILGYKAYRSVASIPEPVDLVIVSVPVPALPGVLEDCIKANAKNIHIFTAGLEETGEEAGRELAKEVRQIISRGGLRVVGPNCMGLYVPEAGISSFLDVSTKSGPVSLISQSGGHCNWFVHHGQDYGIYFDKVISYGNAYGFDSTDFLEYLSTDPKTRIICLYLEGVKDGNKLLRLVQNIHREKPVIIWKAGLTVAGSKAVASHTASLAGQQAVWQAFFAQSGAIQVFSMEEMAEIAMTFLYVTPPRGNRAALLTFGGGNSVAAADVCSREGLEVPTLSQDTRDKLREFIPISGTSIKNPLDTGFMYMDLSLLDREINLITADPNIDFLIVIPSLDEIRTKSDEQVDSVMSYLSELALAKPNGKPVVITFYSFRSDPWERKMRARLLFELSNKGIATYQNLNSAARALARFVRYHKSPQ